MMFVHPQSKSIAFKAIDPLAIRDLFPNESRMVTHPDMNVQVRHTDETTKVLRNLGLEVPAPILSQYNWPGKFIPFDHQRIMADVMTINPRVFNLSEMGCVSNDTEYLSPEGWRRIDQYTGGKVAQYWPKNGTIEFVEPTEYVKLPCTKMIRFKTTRGVDQLLSPEHRVLLADGRVVSAQSILDNYGTQNIQNRRTRFSTTFTLRQRRRLTLSDENIRVQIAANADGWFYKGRYVRVRLKRPRKIARMQLLLEAAKISYTMKLCLPTGFVLFQFEAPMLKGFGKEWWRCDTHQLFVVGKEVTHWDGSRRRNDGYNFTGTKRDADFVQYAWSAHGRRVTMAQDLRSPDVWNVFAGSGDPTIGIYGRNGTQVSSNVRVEPSPDGFKYCFMVPSTFLLLRRNNCIVATGNTGKTYAALWASDWLMNVGLVHKALVLAPLSTIDVVWRQDIFDILMHRNCAIVHGGLDKRRQALEADVDFYVSNHDAVTLNDFVKTIRKRKDIDLIIVDEASIFRNAGTDKFRFLEWMIEKKVRLWLLTGTPCPNAPTDAWALARLVDKSRVPEYFGRFQAKTMVKVSQYKWAPKPQGTQLAYEAMRPAVRFKKADCLTLPPVVTLARQARLTKEQKIAYEGMKRDMVLAAQQGQVNAVNAADKINKLRQILCGSVKDPTTDSYIDIPHQFRTQELLDCIAQASSKALVIVPFKGIIRSLETEVGKVYSVGVLNGDVSRAARRNIITSFKKNVDPHVLLCHPKVMAHGLNLSEADTLIFYGPIYSNDEYEQVIERFNRTGQKHNMTIVRIGAHPLEWSIYQMVDERRLTQATILDLYASVTQ